MSGERKNTITKSATANTTTKKGLSQGPSRYSDCHRCHDMGKFLSDDENRVDWNAAILYYRTALLHCIYYCCTGFLTENETDEPAHSWIWKSSRAASVWSVCFSRSRNEIHDRFQCWIPSWYCVCIRTGSTQLFKTQTAIQTYNSWSSFGFTWNLPAYISLHLYN